MPYGEQPYIGYSDEQLVQESATQEARDGLDPLTIELAKRLNRSIDEIKEYEDAPVTWGTPEQIEYIENLQGALVLLMDAYDSLLPGISYISIDVGLLNDAAVKARPLVTEILYNRED